MATAIHLASPLVECNCFLEVMIQACDGDVILRFSQSILEQGRIRIPVDVNF